MAVSVESGALLREFYSLNREPKGVRWSPLNRSGYQND